MGVYARKHDIPESDKYGGWWLVKYEDGSEKQINCEPDRNIVVYSGKHGHNPVHLERIQAAAERRARRNAKRVKTASGEGEEA